MSGESPQNPEYWPNGTPVDIRNLFSGSKAEFEFLELGETAQLSDAYLSVQHIGEGSRVFTLSFESFQADDRIIDPVLRGITGEPIIRIEQTLEGLSRLNKSSSIFTQRINEGYPHLSDRLRQLTRSSLHVLADCLETGDYEAVKHLDLDLLDEEDALESFRNTVLDYSQSQAILRNIFSKTVGLAEPSALFRHMRRSSEEEAQLLLADYLDRLDPNQYQSLASSYVETMYKQIPVTYGNSPDARVMMKYVSNNSLPPEHGSAFYARATDAMNKYEQTRVRYRTTDEKHIIHPVISWRRDKNDVGEFVFFSDSTSPDYEDENVFDEIITHRDSLFGALLLAFIARNGKPWSMPQIDKRYYSEAYRGALAPLVVLQHEETLLRHLETLESLVS